MAICPAQCSAPPQQPASAGGRHIKARAFQKHVHTFGCSMFALQNKLASGKFLPQWSPRVRLGLNLGPSPMHARNVYMVLNLITGCVSPHYHCHFDNFSKTTYHGGPDVSGTICWQQLVGLDCATVILLEVSTPTPHSIKYLETPSEGDVPPEELPFVPPAFDSLRTTTAYLMEILKSWRTPDHLANHELHFNLRESHQLKLLSLLVLVNVDGFAGCHKEWLSQLPKVCTTWHVNPP
jgi:hypothetical protein